jgi:predicted dehydrogenase
MTRTIGIGVIGMGWMGYAHSRAYREIQDRFYDSDLQPRLIICADTVEKRAQEAQARLGFERCTTDWGEVFGHPEVEVVNIAAPNGMHLPLIRAAAEAGKHIFCEKPVGKVPAETAQAEYAARQAGALTFVGFNYRWAPVVQYAKQLIEAGELGQLTHYRGRFLDNYASNPYGVLSWRFQQEHGLGTLSDLMVHVIDMAHMIAGPITKVVANRETFIRQRPLATPGEGTHFSLGSADSPMGEVTNEDYVGALVRFGNGVQGTLEACRVINGPQCQMAFEVHGTKGAIRWDFERMNELQLLRVDNNPAEEGYTTFQGNPSHPYHGRFNPGPALGLGYEDLKTIEAYEFLKSVASGQQGQPGFSEALAVANVQTAMQRSWESERWEKVESLKIE